jgi:hypothetical protein
MNFLGRGGEYRPDRKQADGAGGCKSRSRADEQPTPAAVDALLT